MDSPSEREILRREMLGRRDALTREDRASWSESIVRRIADMRAWKDARCVLLYMPIRSETDVRPLMDVALRDGKRICLPRCAGPGLLSLHEVTHPDAELIPGAYAIPEPDPLRCAQVDSRDLDLIVAPGVAFTEDGMRMGYGGGYYDALITSLGDHTLVCMAAFEAQKIPFIPFWKGDRPVHGIATENRIITNGSMGGLR